MIKLGDRVKDSISGCEGIVVAITDWLNGCRRITIQPEELKDGAPVDNFSFDIEQVEYLGSSQFSKSEKALKEVKEVGGPSISPTRNPDPIRR